MRNVMKVSFLYKDKIIEFEIIYKKRKTMSIEIDPLGLVKVKAPLGVSQDYILKCVQNKANWILKKQQEMKNINHKRVVRKISDGETLLYLGKEYPIKLLLKLGSKKIQVHFIKEKEMFLIITNDLDEVKIKFEIQQWYRKKSFEKLKERVDYFERYFDKKVKSIQVKEQKRRWASCTYDNRILFNWRNIMAPSEVFDYIVVHEMCHMDFKDHSKNFWNRVKEIMPEYKNNHMWLKINGIRMVL